MNLKKLLTIAAAAALLPFGLAAPPASADPVYNTRGPDVTVYNTPGGQIVGGRLWNTSCAMYSSTVVRCRTVIWATMIEYTGGRYQNRTGWHFNNLTYLPSDRAAWAANPLGRTGEFTNAGRRWKTECDTPATGRGACRSYIWTRYIQASGGRYSTVDGWVFNNQVLFSSATIAPVDALPVHVLDRAVLTPAGLGPIQRLSSMEDHARLGYALAPSGGDCRQYTSAAPLQARGIDVRAGEYPEERSPLYTMRVTTPNVKTDMGAHVGMTIAQVRALHPELTLVTKSGLYTGNSLTFATIRDGDDELIFYVGENRNESNMPYPSNGSRVTSIESAGYSAQWGGDGC